MSCGGTSTVALATISAPTDAGSIAAVASATVKATATGSAVVLPGAGATATRKGSE
jgi:hypothetical protein